MLYIIDGYNVTRADPVTRAAPVEAQRDALVARVKARRGTLLGNGRVVIVFDGTDGIGVSSAGNAPVEVRFSRGGESADDLIVRIVAAAGEHVCLVSSDSGLVSRARTHAPHGLEVRGRETLFEAASRGRARKGGSRYPASTAGLPKGANRVTEELKRLWLPENEE